MIKFEINHSTLRYLRKQHKDWSDVKIKEEAQKIFDKYVEDHKERLEEEAKKDKEAFDHSVDMEFTKLLMNQN